MMIHLYIYTVIMESHFKNKNPDISEAAHESASHTPLIIKGGGLKAEKRKQGFPSL